MYEDSDAEIESDIDDPVLTEEVEHQLATVDDDIEYIDADPDVPIDEEFAPMVTEPSDNNRLAIRRLIRADESRQPDIPSVFELTSIIISRACTISANSHPLVPFDRFVPRDIARDELIQGKSMRSILRGDTEWKWSDFAYFPQGFFNTEDTTESLHEIT